MRGLIEVQSGNIVTFGITPTYPETGYGYLELSQPNDGSVPVKLSRFVEKPDSETANKMIVSGNYHWSSGIFMVWAHDMVRTFQSFASNLINPIKGSIKL